MPEDFRLRSLYGIGRDWPLSYDELENYYCEAEEIMAISGPDDGAPYPRSRPYPQPPHRFSDPDKLLKRRFPDEFFNQATARPSKPVASGRPKCCASGVCGLCPINSKFTVLNELRYLYENDPRVSLLVGARVLNLEIANNMVSGVRFEQDGTEHVVRADLVGLGANAIFNPHIMLRSGLTDASLGLGLAEQVSARVDINLQGVDNFQGSTSITGSGYMLYRGRDRKERAAALMESWNMPQYLRNERGQWRRRLILKFIYEDLPLSENRVMFDAANPDKPQVRYTGHSSYADRGLRGLDSELGPILGALPATSYRIEPMADPTESHILCTTPMGTDSAESVVDRNLMHHRIRNLLVLGGSVFPTTTPSNPTLTISALSLRAADHVLTSQ
jgi:choline dehydrogenase-like flavoprotein